MGSWESERGELLQRCCCWCCCLLCGRRGRRIRESWDSILEVRAHIRWAFVKFYVEKKCLCFWGVTIFCCVFNFSIKVITCRDALHTHPYMDRILLFCAEFLSLVVWTLDSGENIGKIKIIIYYKSSLSK